MVSQPDISVIIRTHDRARESLLLRALDSVLSQTYQGSIETIIAHNGDDMDYFEEIKTIVNDKFDTANKNRGIKGFENRRVVVTHADRGTPGAAANAGVEAAGGVWLTFLDDDDRLTPALFDYLLMLTDDTVSIVQAKVRVETPDGFVANYIESAINNVYSKTRSKWTDNYFLARSLFINVATKLYRKSLFDSFDHFDEEVIVGEDLLFWVANFWKLRKKLAVPDLSIDEGYIINRTSESNSSNVDIEARINLIMKLNTLKEYAEDFYHIAFIETLIREQNKIVKSGMSEIDTLTAYDIMQIMDYLFRGETQENREFFLLQTIINQEAVIIKQRRQLIKAGVLKS